ncbi:glycoside hydrolase family 44-domain-containing protein [Abortiporus biennis]|nr:glycoside hydrolase family 44-domain-containing protein [Abortiporus biennis]
MAWLASSLAILFLTTTIAKADQIIYSDDSLSNGWQDWSWGSTLNYQATNIAEGTTSLSVNSTAWAAVSLYTPTPFGSSFAGLRFDISGDEPPIQFYIQSTTDNSQSPTISLTAFSTSVTSDNFTSILVNFAELPPTGAPLGNGTWDRINFQAEGDGAVYNIDNIILVDEIVVTPKFLSAEPIGTNLIAVTSQGAVNFTGISVNQNGKAVKVKSITNSPVVDIPNKSITYLTLENTFSAGTLVITAVDGTSFNYTLPKALSGTVNQLKTFPINDNVYGVNFPTDADYIKNLGVTAARKGGNAETAYNPFGDFTNAGNDWYFENRANDNADDWVGWVQGADADAILLLPALDWVSKDTSSYSYPKTVYPDQQSFDPYNADAGDGLLPNGSWVSPPDPSLVYAPWNVSAAQTYLTGLKNKPQTLTIDNEIEIASSTHQDMHPDPLGYDEILKRVLDFGTVAKQAIPEVQIAAPSTCAWWFYWTSSIGDADKAAHNGSDFLPWFLQQMQIHDKAAGKRLLDFLDIHYYYAPDTSANDAAAKALRLRMSRSLWDPTYTDESWIGTNAPSNTQPNANQVMLIPRMQALINKYYPGTKLSIGEFSSGADTDLTGGLLTADMIGIFGKYKLDQATYWATPDEKGPVGLAYWLYRGYGTYFGTESADVSITGLNPDTLAVYAGTNTLHNNATLVVINKDPDTPVALKLSGIPTGSYFLRHFGGQAGVAKYQTTISVSSTQYLVIPAYTAAFLQQRR